MGVKGSSLRQVDSYSEETQGDYQGLSSSAPAWKFDNRCTQQPIRLPSKEEQETIAFEEALQCVADVSGLIRHSSRKLTEAVGAGIRLL